MWRGVEASDQSRKSVGSFSICDGNGSENITQTCSLLFHLLSFNCQMLANFKRLYLSSRKKNRFLVFTSLSNREVWQFQKNFSFALRASVWSKNKAGAGPPGPLPWISHCKINKPISFCRSHSRHRRRY